MSVEWKGENLRTTIKQIAERSGLSVPTVSRILSNKGESHLLATRERVLQVARELGYRPNMSARAMRQGRTGTLALLQSGTDQARSLLPAELLAGLLAATAEYDLHLTVAAVPDARLTDQGFMPKILREWSADGLLINYNADIPKAMIELIQSHELPAVWINSMQSADCVYPDDERGGQEATERLLHLGHERIAYATMEGVGHYSDSARRRGYDAAMQRARKSVQHLIVFRHGNVGQESLTNANIEILKGSQAPTAIVCYNTQAVQATIHLATAAGVSTPRALSIIGFCVSPYEALGIRAIDTMVLPELEMGWSAVRMLIRKIEEPHISNAPLPIPYRFEGGWTTAPL